MSNIFSEDTNEIYTDLKSELQQIKMKAAALGNNQTAESSLGGLFDHLDSFISKLEINFQESAPVSKIIDSIPDMLGYWDKDLRNVYCNQAYTDFFGLSPKRIKGEHISFVLGEEIYNKNLRYIQAALRGESQSFHREMPTQNHGCKMTYVKYIPNVVENEVVGFFVTVTDITEHSKVSDELFHIFHHTRDLMCIASTDGTFKRISPSFTRILGFQENELVGKPFLDFIHPEDYEKTKFIVGDLVLGKPLINFENRYRTKLGDYRLISWVCEPDTKTGLLYATGRDITELRDAEVRSRAIQDTIDKSALISFTDPTGKITAVNDNFCKISGYDRSELIGQDHRIINSKTHSKVFFKKLWDQIENHEIWIGDLTNRRKDGSLYNVRSAIAPIKNLRGQTEQYVAVRFDVTEQVNLERQLVEAQSIAKIGSWRFDLNTKELSWTTEHYKIFEIPEPQTQDDLYRLYRERIHPDDIAQLDVLISRAFQHNEDFVFHHRVCLDEGKRIKYVRGIGKVTKSGKGQAIYISGTCQDLTEIIQLQEQNQFILDSTGVGVWKFNPATSELEWDASMYKLFEIKKENFTGDYQAWKNSLKSSEKENIINEFNAALKEKTEYSSVFEILTPSGSVKYIRARATIVRDESNRAIMAYGINWDQTKEVLLEKAIEKERALSIHSAKMVSLGEMSASIAHEINNPLAIIYGLVSLLDRYKNSPEKFNEKIDSLARAANRINKIVSGLKKFSRSNIQQDLKLESLNSIINEVIALTESKAKRYSSPIVLDLENDLKIMCDVVEIEQVLINLINNSIDAIKDKDERWVKIVAKTQDSEVILQIIDSGLGISHEVEAKLFEPFFTTKPVGEGTGLGLSITKGILDQHNASICIDRSSKNTCFKISFPNVEAKMRTA